MSTEAVVTEGDIFALSYIDAEILSLEWECFKSKWFDYRALHPSMATSLFGKTFNLIKAEIHRKEVDENEAKWMLANAHKFRLEEQTERNIKAFWRARQVADLIGMRYDLFCRAAFDFLRNKKSWKRMPNPSQLYAKDVVAACVAAWEFEKKAQLIKPKSRFCLADSDAWFKKEFDQWFIGQIVTRQNKNELLKAAVEDGILTVQSIKEVLCPPQTQV